ncbi:MAG TPA: hypothetical protein GX717_04085, partial [Clostridiaceae bacterium]|nr:hypothetical protein [Clostridiaceae bacterium]
MRKLQPARPMYTVSRVIYGYDLGLDSFSKPQNVFISETGDIYISDSGNGRLIILDAEMKLKEVMSEFTFEGQTLDVTGLAGVFIDSQNRLYIADPEHERVLICDGSGAVERILTLPESSLIPEDFRFIPTKVLADSGGTIYVISQGSFYGAIMYAPDFSFAGFFGSNRVRVRIQDIPEKIIEKLFSNNEKKGASLQALPYQFTGFCIDDRDFIYTSTGMISGWYVTPGQVKKMSPGGVNILKARVGRNMVGADYIDFGDIGISVRENNMKRIQDFCDIDVDDNGLIYLLDKTYGRIFIYNNECVLLNAFGGGAENGKQKGTYAIASSIAVSRSGETIAVTDMNKNSLTIYLQTPYGELFNEANRLSMNGDYAKALPLWKTVVSEDRNNQLALRSIAQIFLAEKEYENALEYARASLDQDTYSQAFIVVRNKYMSRNAWWMTLILISVAACAVIAAIRTKKHGLVFAQNRKVRIMYSSILHP